MPYRPEMAIDIAQVLKDKRINLPSPAVSLIRRILHLDFINEFLVQGYEGVELCSEALRYLDVKLEVEGLENVPDDGTLYTFASNHPLGGIDGVALGAIVGGKFGDRVGYLVNDFLMAVKGLAPICVPINKTGAQSRDLPRLIDDLFASDRHVVLCPAGLCSRRIDGKIQDIPWGKTFIAKSVKNGRSVVPIHFVAQNSPRFYRVASLCKKLGLKFNFAMVLLPDEMVKARHSTFKVVIGKPIPPSHFDRSRSAYEWAQWVREEVYKL